MKNIRLFSFCCLFGFGSLAQGAGFGVQERSIKGLGRAFSAEAAMADDASVIASNPAGLINLAPHSYSVGMSVIDGHFGATGSSALAPATTLKVDDLSPLVAVPSLYYSHKYNEKWSYGLGVFSNFGLKSEYPASFRPVVTEVSELTTVNFNPSVAYKVNANWSIGGGVSLVYAESKLTGNFGANGRLNLEGDDLGFGYNLGVLYDSNKGTKVGLSYRSSVALSLEGRGQNTLGLSAPVLDSEATADAKLPGIVELSVVQQLGEKWMVHGDFQYTRWGAFQRLQATSTSGGVILNNREEWEDSYKLSVGATYQASDDLTLRFGAAYDHTPVKSASLRTLRIPDSDRVWLSCGLTYDLNPNYSLDFGYTYVFSKGAQINEPASANGLFVGEASGFSHVVGLGVSGQF